MSTKNIEGQEYILKSAVDEIVRQRIAKYSEKLTAAETKLGEYQSQLDEAKAKSGLVDNLTQQIESMKGELNQANNRYERHSVISNYGITDGSIRDAIEWAYDKQMDATAKKDRVQLSDWLTGINENPETAPAFLRPFFGDQAKTQPAQQTAPQVTPGQPMVTAPQPNTGVKNAPNTSQDLLQKASDPQFYNANREAIREAWYQQSKGTSPFKF